VNAEMVVVIIKYCPNLSSLTIKLEEEEMLEKREDIGKMLKGGLRMLLRLIMCW
jgi:hypothetical protein